MPIVAAITRASVSRFFSQQGSLNAGNEGGNAYTLRKADGTSLGTYRSVSEAQGVFNRFHGPSRVYRWERRDLAGDIEQHVCIGTPLNASEIWILRQPNPRIPNSPGDTALRQWTEPASVPNSVKLQSVTTGVINTINDISGNDNPLVAVDEPLYVESDPNFNSKPVVDFDDPPGSGFNVPNLGAISAPYTMIMVANNLDPGGNGFLWNTDVFPRLEITETPAGHWRMIHEGTGDIDSMFTGGDRPDILVIKAQPVAGGTNLTFRVNGTDWGTLFATDVAGEVELGGHNLDPWDGRLAFHMIANIADADNTRIVQTERYLRAVFSTVVPGA